MVTPLKTLMGFSVHLNVQLKFYNLPKTKDGVNIVTQTPKRIPNDDSHKKLDLYIRNSNIYLFDAKSGLTLQNG